MCVLIHMFGVDLVLSAENDGENPRKRRYCVESRRSLQSDPRVVLSNARAV